MGELSANDKIVYSALLFHSISNTAEHYDEEGVFDKSALLEIIEYNYDRDNRCEVFYIPPSINKLSEVTEMTRNTVRKCIYNLTYKHGLISGEHLACPSQLAEMGYVDYPSRHLKGKQLVFYLYLKDRSYLYNGVIDTWAVKLAEGINTNKKSVYNMLYILEENGIVQRLSNNKLWIK